MIVQPVHPDLVAPGKEQLEPILKSVSYEPLVDVVVMGAPLGVTVLVVLGAYFGAVALWRRADAKVERL